MGWHKSGLVLHNTIPPFVLSSNGFRMMTQWLIAIILRRFQGQPLPLKSKHNTRKHACLFFINGINGDKHAKKNSGSDQPTQSLVERFPECAIRQMESSW